MTISSYVVQCARSAGEEFFRYARAVPTETLTWNPQEVGQSVLSMCREIAITPTWAYQVLAEEEISPAEHEEAFELIDSWTDLETCFVENQARFEMWADYVLNMPESRLSESRWLPFNGGRDHTYLELLDYVRWNTTYHTGQVAYIQKLYGDNNVY